MPLRRPGSQRRAGRSHYQFKNWTWDHCGKRASAVAIRPLRGEYADLINTCYYNPAKGSETLYCLGFDLDAHRASAQWKNADGTLDWEIIRAWLEANHGAVFGYIFAAVRSTGGKGLALYLAMSPLELVRTTKKAQLAAKVLQEKLVLLFNEHGLGADLSAAGLKRDFCNWRNPKRCIYSNESILRRVQSQRTSVVKELLAYLKPYNIANYVRKSERSDLLYSDIRAEGKLGILYTYLHEQWLEGERTVYLSVASLQKLTSLSRPFVEKLLKKPPTWLAAKYVNRAEGWELTVKLKQELTLRASELSQLNGTSVDLSKTLCKPEQVKDGERNLWITSACLRLKHSGIHEISALAYLKDQIAAIPGSESSKNCKSLGQIVRSIYANHRDLFGINKNSAPAWLVARKEQTQKEISDPQNQLPTVLERGGIPPKKLLKKVSRDRCIIFKRNYYTVPMAYVGCRVFPVENSGTLAIYRADGKTLICTHLQVVSNKGRYQSQLAHLEPLTDLENQYLKNQIARFASDDEQIGLFARNLVERHGVFAVRRLWLLRAMVAQVGSSLVAKASVSARSLKELRERIMKFKQGERSQRFGYKIDIHSRSWCFDIDP